MSERKVVEKYEDLSPAQKLMLYECQAKALQGVARDLAKNLSSYWIQQLINNLKLEMWAKQGKIVDDRPKEGEAVSGE